MSYVIGVILAAVLFAVFGMLGRHAVPRAGCGGCDGRCGSVCHGRGLEDAR